MTPAWRIVLALGLPAFLRPVVCAQNAAPAVPPALAQAAAEFKEHFQANEDHLRRRYEAGLAAVRSNPHLSLEARRRFATQMYENYRAGSAANVARYREPLVQAIAAEAVRRGGGQGHLEQSLGSAVVAPDGAISATHRGARGDTDMGGTAGRAAKAAEVATDLGFTAEAGNPNYLDIKQLELTINYEAPGQAAQGRGWTDTPGSSAHEAIVQSAARADETYISVAMSEGQTAKQAVLVQDHLKKANHGREVAAGDLLTDGHQAELQVYSKGALKAAEAAGINEAQLGDLLTQGGLEIGPQEYREMLDKLKLGYPPEAVGLDAVNAEKFKRTTDALLDTADARSVEIAREQFALHERQLAEWQARATDPALAPEDRADAQRQLERGQLELMDSRIRLREARQANAETRGIAVEHLAGTPRAQPGIDPAARVTPIADQPQAAGTRRPTLTGLGSGAAKGADVVDMVILAGSVAKLAAEGDGQGLAALIGDLTWGAGTEALSVSALAKLSPNLAVAYETFTTAHGATRTFMELPIPGTGGHTFDDVTQNTMLASFDLVTGAGDDDRAKREAGAAMLHVAGLRKEGFTVAGGLTGPEIIARINENIAAGRDSLEGIRFEYPESANPGQPAAVTRSEEPPAEETVVRTPPATVSAEASSLVGSPVSGTGDNATGVPSAPTFLPSLDLMGGSPKPVVATAGGALSSKTPVDEGSGLEKAKEIHALQRETISLMADFLPHLNLWEREFNRALDEMETTLLREKEAVEAQRQAGTLAAVQFQGMVDRYNARAAMMRNYNDLLMPVSWRRAGEAHLMIKQMMQSDWVLNYNTAAMEKSVLAGVPIGEKGSRLEVELRGLDPAAYQQVGGLFSQMKAGMKSGAQALAELRPPSVPKVADGPERLGRHFLVPPIPDWKPLAGLRPSSPLPAPQVVGQDAHGVWTWEWQEWNDTVRETRQALVHRTHQEIEANRRIHGRAEGATLLGSSDLVRGVLHGLLHREERTAERQFVSVAFGEAVFSAEGRGQSQRVGWEMNMTRHATDEAPFIEMIGYENGRAIQKFDFTGERVDRAELLVMLDEQPTWWRLSFDDAGQVAVVTEGSRFGAGGHLGKEVRFEARFGANGQVTHIETRQGEGWGWVKDGPLTFTVGRMVDGRRVGVWTRYALADGRAMRQVVYSAEGKMDLAATRHFTSEASKEIAPGPRPTREDFLDYRPVPTKP